MGSRHLVTMEIPRRNPRDGVCEVSVWEDHKGHIRSSGTCPGAEFNPGTGRCWHSRLVLLKYVRVGFVPTPDGSLVYMGRPVKHDRERQAS